MQCPACGRELTERTIDGVTVDVCEAGCAGIWFDWLELKRFDEPHEEAGKELLEIAPASGLSIDRSKQLNCPRCGDAVMMRHFFSVKREVEIDECPSCGGFWLDVGELRKIRSQFPSEAAREDAAKQYFHDVFGDRMNEIREEHAEKTEKLRRILRIFRFISPTYYIPGKQEWGAY